MHRFRSQAATHDAAVFFAPDETGVGQHIEVLHHCRKRHRKRLGELADRQSVFAQSSEQGPTSRVSQGCKRAIQVRLAIVNHLVNYRIVRACVKPVNIHLSLRKELLKSGEWIRSPSQPQFRQTGAWRSSAEHRQPWQRCCGHRTESQYNGVVPDFSARRQLARERRLDQLDRVLARPFGGTSDAGDLATLRVNQ
jgi:hypothetical protein